VLGPFDSLSVAFDSHSAPSADDLGFLGGVADLREEPRGRLAAARSLLPPRWALHDGLEGGGLAGLD